MRRTKTWALVVGPMLSSAMWFGMFVSGLSAEACWVAAVTVLCAVWWITEPIPIPATSIIPFAAFPLFGVLDHRQVAAAYGHTLILLFLGGFLLSAAMEKSGAHRRLALGMVRSLGGVGGKRLVLAFMLATALMMLPIALAVINQSKY